MMGSMAIDAWLSQYASACSRGVSLLKLSASSCRKPVEPTRSTSVLLAAAPAAALRLVPQPTSKATLPPAPQLSRNTAAAAQLAPHPKRNDFNLPSLIDGIGPAYTLDAGLAIP